jgi:hypothetical protein
LVIKFFFEIFNHMENGDGFDLTNCNWSLRFNIFFKSFFIKLNYVLLCLIVGAKFYMVQFVTYFSGQFHFNFTFVQTVQLKSQFSETRLNFHKSIALFFFEIFVQFTVNIEGSACFSI